MKKNLYIACCTIFSTAAVAQDPPPSSTVFFEEPPQVQPELLLNQPNLETTASVPTKAGNSMEEKINFAIISKDWQKLEKLLSQYHKIVDYDQILYNYGLGALYRHQGRQKEAINLYQQILERQPSLHYPRFDLAMMLYEDKRYSEAEAQLRAAKPYLSPELKVLTSQLLNNIKKSQDWKPLLNFSYETTDNVNQASDLKELVIGDATFIRSDASLPQEANGIRYDIGATQEKNFNGNHYIYKGAELRGVNYWDNNDYNELTLQAGLGYRYKELKQSWGAIMRFEQNLLGGSQYNQNYSATLNYNRKISKKLQISGSFSHSQKRYEEDDLAEYYDGHSNSTAWIVLYQPKPRWLVYAGADAMNDSLADEAESSDRYGIRGGMVYSGKNISLRNNVRYAKRDFWADNFWYGEKRKDNEYQFSTSISHKKFSWKGFMPKLNYKYQKIDSNLPLYERSNSSLFVEIDKKF